MIEFYQGSNQRWFWRAVAKNGKVVADSAEGYASKGNAQRAARRAAKLLASATIYS